MINEILGTVCVIVLLGYLAVFAFGMLQGTLPELRKPPRAIRANPDFERKHFLSFRADQQHQLFLRGDPRGSYGEYPPADLTTHKPHHDF